MATPFLSGFYSKDAVLEAAAGAYTVSGAAAFTLGTLGATLTAFYSFRLLLLTFFTNPNANKKTYINIHEAPFLLGAPLVFLSVLSVVGGYFGRDLFLGLGTDYLSTALFQLPGHVAIVEAEFGLPQLVKLLPALGTLVGALSAVGLYQMVPVNRDNYVQQLTSNSVGRYIYDFLNAKWQWDAIINGLFIRPGLALGHQISKTIDRGVIELAGPYGLSQVLPATAHTVARLDSGAVVTSYALTILVGLLVVIVSVFVAPILLGSDTLGLVLVILIGLAIYIRQYTS